MRKIVSFLPGIAVAMSNVALDISGYQNPTLSLILWVIAGALFLVAAIYWINVKIRGGGKAQGLGGSRMVDHRSDEESGRYIDNRSQSMSNSPGGQQAFGDIINQGPQPRDISQSAGKALVRELQKYDPERFQISWMTNDAESAELGARLQQLLEQSGWTMAMLTQIVALPGGPPRGVIVETTSSSEVLNMLVSWLERVNLNPYLNRGAQQFDRLAPPSDSPPAPVHVVVGVLPR